MKFCPDCDPETSCCDFCRHYNFNGRGFCKLTKEQRDFGDQICDNFYCALIKEVTT